MRHLDHVQDGLAFDEDCISSRTRPAPYIGRYRFMSRAKKFDPGQETDLFATGFFKK
jgi:hypothetical protein